MDFSLSQVESFHLALSKLKLRQRRRATEKLPLWLHRLEKLTSRRLAQGRTHCGQAAPSPPLSGLCSVARSVRGYLRQEAALAPRSDSRPLQWSRPEGETCSSNRRLLQARLRLCPGPAFSPPFSLASGSRVVDQRRGSLKSARGGPV